MTPPTPPSRLRPLSRLPGEWGHGTGPLELPGGERAVAVLAGFRGAVLPAPRDITERPREDSNLRRTV